MALDQSLAGSAEVNRKVPTMASCWSGGIAKGSSAAVLPIAIDKEVYKWRHLIENFFCKLKELNLNRKPNQSMRFRRGDHIPTRP
jgi:hypothetical protein